MAGYRKTKRDVLELFIHNLINNLLNVFLYLGYFFGKIFKGQHKQLLRNIELKDIYTGQRCFVLGNGPSLNNQKIELLKDEVVFMVNRSFLDPRYADISPKYHVIIDDKLSTGEWPITYLDEILNKNVTSAIKRINIALDGINIYAFYNNLLANLRTNIYISKCRDLGINSYDISKKLNL